MFNRLSFPPPFLQDFCVQAIMCFLILISMIVAAAYAPYSSAAVAAAVSLPLYSYATAHTDYNRARAPGLAAYLDANSIPSQ